MDPRPTRLQLESVDCLSWIDNYTTEYEEEFAEHHHPRTDPRNTRELDFFHLVLNS